MLNKLKPAIKPPLTGVHSLAYDKKDLELAAYHFT
jgi:hypothetical protein